MKRLTYAKVDAILSKVRCMDYGFDLYIDDSGDYARSLVGWYFERDVVTGQMERQETREWPLPAEADESAIVRTAFKCVMTSLEHRAREHFLYKDRPVFGPHFTVQQLWELAPSRSAA